MQEMKKTKTKKHCVCSTSHQPQRLKESWIPESDSVNSDGLEDQGHVMPTNFFPHGLEMNVMLLNPESRNGLTFFFFSKIPLPPT